MEMIKKGRGPEPVSSVVIHSGDQRFPMRGGIEAIGLRERMALAVEGGLVRAVFSLLSSSASTSARSAPSALVPAPLRGLFVCAVSTLSYLADRRKEGAASAGSSGDRTLADAKDLALRL
jgi:hypothetical protein